MSRAAWLVVAVVAVAGCKKGPEPVASKPECEKSTDCPAGQECAEGRCVAEMQAAVLDDSPCGRALANVDRLNSSEGHAAMELDLADLMKECKGWPPALITCLEQAKDMRAYRVCAEKLMDLERAKLKAKKAAAAAPREEKSAPAPAGDQKSAPEAPDDDLEPSDAVVPPPPPSVVPASGGLDPSLNKEGGFGARGIGIGGGGGGLGASPKKASAHEPPSLSPEEPPSLSPVPTPAP